MRASGGHCRILSEILFEARTPPIRRIDEETKIKKRFETLTSAFDSKKHTFSLAPSVSRALSSRSFELHFLLLTLSKYEILQFLPRLGFRRKTKNSRLRTVNTLLFFNRSGFRVPVRRRGPDRRQRRAKWLRKWKGRLANRLACNFLFLVLGLT